MTYVSAALLFVFHPLKSLKLFVPTKRLCPLAVLSDVAHLSET